MVKTKGCTKSAILKDISLNVISSLSKQPKKVESLAKSEIINDTKLEHTKKTSSGKKPKRPRNIDEDLGLRDIRSDGKPRTFTTEGFKVYTESELKLGEGKDTPECPFDCSCCF